MIRHLATQGILHGGSWSPEDTVLLIVIILIGAAVTYIFRGASSNSGGK